MVRDVFRLARENSPSVVFIDEIDAIATKRFDAQTGADREVQRILLELLNQMDGFDQSTNVKVCTTERSRRGHRLQHGSEALLVYPHSSIAVGAVLCASQAFTPRRLRLISRCANSPSNQYCCILTEMSVSFSMC